MIGLNSANQLDAVAPRPTEKMTIPVVIIPTLCVLKEPANAISSSPETATHNPEVPIRFLPNRSERYANGKVKASPVSGIKDSRNRI